LEIAVLEQRDLCVKNVKRDITNQMEKVVKNVQI